MRNDNSNDNRRRHLIRSLPLAVLTLMLLCVLCGKSAAQLRVSTSDGAKTFNGVQELIFPPNSVTIVPGQTGGRSALISAGGGTGVPGSGLRSLNAMIGTTQTFSFTSDTNVTLNIASASNNHAFTLGWTGTLAKARQHAATVYYDQANTYTVSFLQSFFAGASNIEFRDPTTPSKKFTFDASNISASTTRTVNIPNANSTTAQSLAAVSHFFINAMSAQGVFTASQPACADLSDGGVFCSGTNAANLTGTLSLSRLGLANTHIYVGNGSGNPADVALSGDCTIANTGAITCTKTSGTTFGYFATGTDASNLTGTLSAARLPTSVPTSVVNDTNVTGSIASNVLTLGWTGTLASGRLNSNVVQAITNDTNITGSISSQNLTLAWSGTLAKARQHSATVYNDQANTYSSSVLQSFFAGASNIEFRDPTTSSKKFTFDASNISASTTRTVNIPDANSTTAQAKSSTASQWLNAMSAQGVFTASQPSCGDLSDCVTGTWTPTRNGFTEVLGGGSITNYGTYRKVGKLVTVNAYLVPAGGATIAGVASVGSYITGLPFAGPGGNIPYAAGTYFKDDFSAGGSCGFRDTGTPAIFVTTAFAATTAGIVFTVTYATAS